MLSNSELRERYDQHGSQGLDVNFMDGADFFGALFGSMAFDHLVRATPILPLTQHCSVAVAPLHQGCASSEEPTIIYHPHGLLYNLDPVAICFGDS